MFRPVEPFRAWPGFTDEWVALAGVEIFSSPILMQDALDVGDKCQAIEASVEFAGEDHPTVNASLRFYRAIGSDPGTRDFVAYRNKTLTSTGAVGVGAELVTNGGFGTDTDWTKEQGWTIAAGRGTFDDAGGSGSAIHQSVTLAGAGAHMLAFDRPTAIITSPFAVELGAQEIARYNSAADQPLTTGNRILFNAVAAGAQRLAFRTVPNLTSGAFDFTIDNVSLRSMPICKHTEISQALIDGPASSVVLGLFPIASMSGTFARLRYRRYGPY